MIVIFDPPSPIDDDLIWGKFEKRTRKRAEKLGGKPGDELLQALLKALAARHGVFVFE